MNLRTYLAGTDLSDAPGLADGVFERAAELACQSRHSNALSVNQHRPALQAIQKLFLLAFQPGNNVFLRPQRAAFEGNHLHLGLRRTAARH